MKLESLYQELTSYQERMHRKSKALFRRFLKNKAEQFNFEYEIVPEKGLAKNVIIGNIRTAKYIIGAHYDTPPKMPSFVANNIVAANIASIIFPIVIIIMFIFFPIIAAILFGFYIFSLVYLLGFFSIANKKNYNDNTSGVLVLLYLMSKIKKDEVAYVFFDNEEKGLIGSFSLAAFMRKQNIKLSTKEYYILDCVGRGKSFRFSSFRNNKLSSDLIDIANEINKEDYCFEVTKGNIFEISDHLVFCNYNHVGIMSYEFTKNKYKIRNIHSRKDRYLDLGNIRIISDIIKNYLDRRMVWTTE